MKTEFIDGLVSVIIPTFNSEQYIEQTINSVLRQTYKNVEIIVYDDCSSDLTTSIVKRIQCSHKNVYIYISNVNQGAGISRNNAIKIAKGRYIAFLDSDDLWNEYKVEKQIRAMNSLNVSFCFTAIEMIDQDNKIIKKKRKIKNKVTFKTLLRNTVIATSTVVVDRFLIGEFEMSHRRGGQDYATWLELLKRCDYAYGIDEPLCQYRTGSKSSLSGNKWKSIKQVWSIQREDQKISRIKASFNVMFFIINAFKKYFL